VVSYGGANLLQLQNRDDDLNHGWLYTAVAWTSDGVAYARTGGSHARTTIIALHAGTYARRITFYRCYCAHYARHHTLRTHCLLAYSLPDGDSVDATHAGSSATPRGRMDGFLRAGEKKCTRYRNGIGKTCHA